MKGWLKLIEKYINNRISNEELNTLLQKVDSGEDAEELTMVLQEHWEKAKEKSKSNQQELDAWFDLVMEEAGNAVPVIKLSKPKKSSFFLRAVAAAIIFIMLGYGGYFLFFNKNKKQAAPISATQENRYKNDLKPGATGAILTLSNGKQIILDSAGNGLLTVQGATKVLNKNGQLIYSGNNEKNGELLYNTIVTPRGSQYQLTLEDGSRVWLNAQSSIRYPAAFLGNERDVEITGEAYFEIAHNKSKPFKVKINNASGNGGEVEVLGTWFNINSYNDEDAIQTTLLQGEVKYSKDNKTAILKPGQQAQLKKEGSIEVHNAVDVEAVMAWKNGFFSFNQSDLPTVMRQIARWYDVDIVYEGKVPDRKFGGAISRNTNASQVLKILEESKIYFRIEGKRIIVLPEDK